MKRPLFPSALPCSVLFGFYALLGFADAATGVASGHLLRLHGLTTGQLAMALLWGTAAALPLLWLSSTEPAQTRRRPVLVTVALSLPVLAWVVFAAPGALAVLVGIAGLATITAMLDATAGGEALALERASRVPLLGGLQSGFAVGALLGALAGGLAVEAGALWPIALTVTVVGFVLALSTRLLPSPPRTPSGIAAASGRSRFPAPTSWLVLIAVAAVGAYYAEGMLQSWNALFLQRDLGASPVITGVLSGGYYVAFGVGTALSGLLVARLGARSALWVLGVTGAFGSVVLGTSTRIAVAAVALLVLGAALAGIMPTLMTLASQVGLGTGAAGFVSTFAYAGMLLEPLVVSAAGDELRVALWTVPFALLAATSAGTIARGRPAVPVPLPAGD